LLRRVLLVVASNCTTKEQPRLDQIEVVFGLATLYLFISLTKNSSARGGMTRDIKIWKRTEKWLEGEIGKIIKYVINKAQAAASSPKNDHLILKGVRFQTTVLPSLTIAHDQG
jgi:hypothetical protein